MARDYLSQVLDKGDYVVYPGGGNRNAEYGLVLYWILEAGDDFIKAVRLDINSSKREIRLVKGTIQSLNKIAKVSPPPKMLEVFRDSIDGHHKHYELVEKWCHGKTPINWETIQIG